MNPILPKSASQAKAGAEKVVTDITPIAPLLTDALQLEQMQIHLLVLDEASKGLADVEAGRFTDARQTLQALKLRRRSQTSCAHDAQQR